MSIQPDNPYSELPPQEDEGEPLWRAPKRKGYHYTDLTEILFSFNGRIGRSQYWVGCITLFIASSIIGMIFHALSGVLAANIISAIIWLLYIFVAIKRFHDMNFSGWFTLLICLPFINLLVATLWLGIMEGTKGENRFGPEPAL